MKKKLTDKMGFGQYRFNTVKEVIEDDLTYIAWALDDVAWFELDDEAMKFYEKALDGHYQDESDFYSWDEDPGLW